MLEQNHWKSPAPSPSHRIRLPLRQSSPPRSHHHDSILQEATTGGSGTIQYQASEMSENRRRISQNSFEKAEVNTSQVPGWESGEVREDYKHSMSSLDNQDQTRRLSCSGYKNLGAENSSSEGEVTDDQEAGLTNVNRAKRRRRRKRHTALDDRVASDVKMSKKEQKLADMSVLKKSAVNALLIGLW